MSTTTASNTSASHRANHRATEPQSHRATEPESHKVVEPASHRAVEPETARLARGWSSWSRTSLGMLEPRATPTRAHCWGGGHHMCVSLRGRQSASDASAGSRQRWSARRSGAQGRGARRQPRCSASSATARATFSPRAAAQPSDNGDSAVAVNTGRLESKFRI